MSIECDKNCKLYGYNLVHNGGECYSNAPFCLRWWEEDVRTFNDDLGPILDVPPDPEDDSIEDPSLP